MLARESGRPLRGRGGRLGLPAPNPGQPAIAASALIRMQQAAARKHCLFDTLLYARPLEPTWRNLSAGRLQAILLAAPRLHCESRPSVTLDPQHRMAHRHSHCIR